MTFLPGLKKEKKEGRKALTQQRGLEYLILKKNQFIPTDTALVHCYPSTSPGMTPSLGDVLIVSL